MTKEKILERIGNCRSKHLHECHNGECLWEVDAEDLASFLAEVLADK